MNTNVKNALKSAGILAALTFVAIGLLILANALIPPYVPKLDTAKVTMLKSFLGMSESVETLQDEGYFSIVTNEEFDLNAFNTDNSNTNTLNKVLAIYYVESGTLEGTFIIETSTNGHDGAMVLMTAYKNNEIVAFEKVSSVNCYILDNAERYNKLKSDVIGQKIPTKSEYAYAGATVSGSAIEKNFTISAACYDALVSGGVR